MLSRLLVTGTTAGMSGWVPLKLENPDRVSTETKTFQNIIKEGSKETGWERVKNIFKLDEFGGISPELNSIYQAGFCGFLIGTIYGGVIQSRVAYLDFMENNQATAFTSHLDAKRKLQNQFTVNFAKGGMKWGWRVGLFTTSYLGIVTCISVYRQKSSIIEYTAAGAITGALFKFKMGLRGMTAGCIIGGGLGAIGGGASLLIMRLTGTTIEDMRYWQQQMREKRDSQVQAALKFNESRDQPDLVKAFEQRVGEKQPTLDDIDKT